MSDGCHDTTVSDSCRDATASVRCVANLPDNSPERFRDEFTAITCVNATANHHDANSPAFTSAVIASANSCIDTTSAGAATINAATVDNEFPAPSELNQNQSFMCQTDAPHV